MRTRPRTLGAIRLAALAIAFAISPGLAQTANDARTSKQNLGAADVRAVKVTVPGVILAEPASETSLPITLGPLDLVPRNGLVRIRGLPQSAALSEGHAIGPGSWAVPVAAAGRLRVTLPPGFSGKSDITIIVVTLDGAMLAEAKSALVVTAATLAPPANAEIETRATTEPPPAIASVIQHYTPPATAGIPGSAVSPPAPPARHTKAGEEPPAVKDVPPHAAAAPPSERPAEPGRQIAALPPQAAPVPPPASATPAPAEPRLSAEARERAAALLKRGEALRKDGNIVEARAFFERAADAGLPEAALALGGTFDPYELSQVRVRGLRPDPSQARRWYEKAKTLGSNEAQARLERLP